MAGPRSKRKRADATNNAPLPRRPRRDAGEGDNPEMTTAATTATPAVVPSGEVGGPAPPPQPEIDDGGESSMEVEDVPHPPLQDQVATEGGQSSASEPIGPSNLAELLSHRNALLRRVRQGRTAAQKRFDLYKRDPSRKDESKDEEIARFKELARIATSLARKQQVQGDASAATEKRTSVSLRRGSSVGKRMNAALSHLSGSLGTAAASASYYEGTDDVQATSLLSSAGKKTGATASMESNDAMPPPTLPDAASTTTPRAVSVGRPPKSDIMQRSSLLSQQDAAPGHHAARLTGQKSTSGTTVSAAAVSRTSFNSLPKGPGRDVKQGPMASQQTLPNGLPGRPTKPTSNRNTVVCPETKALRDRKMRLEENLSQLFRKRVSGNSPALESSALSPSATLSSPSGVSMATGASLQHGAHADKDVSPNQLWKAIRGPQPTIPSYSSASVLRRKTHWDYLLEEMRWLATDFIEERKWKRCATQNISSAVLLNVNQSASLPTKPAPRIAAESSERTIQTGESLGSVGKSSQESNRVSNAKDTLLYTDPSLEDLAKAKEIASMVSCMIIGLSACPPCMSVEQVATCNSFTTTLELSGGSVQSTTFDQGTTLNHPQCFNSPDPMDVSPKKNEAIGSNSGDESSTRAPSFNVQDPSVRETELRRFSDYVESIVSKVDATNKPKPAASTTGFPFTASTGQLAAVASIEDLWLRVSAGVVLGGPVHSGKTIISCSCLWKFRNEGPQLVVCSPLSMIKWMHELGRFVELNRKPVAVDVGYSSPIRMSEDGKHFVPCDVVLCEFSSLHCLSNADICNFSTVVIDSRHPSGFFGSRATAYGESIPLAGNVETPADLLDPSWWSKFSGTKPRPRRLLIEVAAPSKCLPFLRDLPDRQLLEVLALRLSFLLGGSALQLEGFSQAKSVLAWARRKIRSSIQKGSKFERIREFLVTCLDTFYCEIHGATRLDDSSPTWEVCLCDMPVVQRRVYNQVCRESRAALSSRNGSITRVAEFLLRLRRVCLHSELQHFLSLSRGPSQPDRDLALRVLNHSGKFQKLLSILKLECDLDVDVDDTSEFVSLRGRSKSLAGTNQRSDGPMKRVAILASLPEARAVSSLLLNCLGVMHDVVPPDGSKVGAETELESQAVAWAKSQLALSRFNDPMHENGQVHIVITSLEAVAGDTCGLGVELADLIISLDEDWSGRSELQMKSLVVRCNSRRQAPHCRFVKVVAASSCEQTFLSKATYEDNESTERKEMISWPYRISPFGSFSALLSLRKNGVHADFNSSSFQRPDYFAFPAANVMAWRNKSLSTVLSIDFSLNPLFVSTDEMAFLPNDPVEASTFAAENALAARLIECESTTPPFRIDMYNNVGRRDLAVLSSRLHLRYLGFDSITQQLNESVKLGVHFSATTSHDLQVNHATGVMHVDFEATLTGCADVGLDSLLFYGQDTFPIESAERANSYSITLSATKRPGLVIDSNSGDESLVYFPPLFPRLLECHEAAQSDIARRLLTSSAERQSSESLAIPVPKRPRLDSDSFVDILGFDAADASADNDSEKRSAELLMTPGHVTEDEASHKDAASVLLDLREDYGVVGIGAISIPQDSTLAAAAASVSPHHGTQLSDLLTDGVASVQEEAEQILAKGLDSVVLFVSRKRPRGYAGYSNQSSPSFQRLPTGPPVWAMGVNSLPRSQDGVVSFADANGASKKMKKKILAQGSGVSAFNRLSGAEANPNHSRVTAILPSPKSRDIYRSRLLTSLKQTAPSRTLFDAPPFRAASARVRRRIADRLCHQLWTSPSVFDSGSGLPLLSATANESVQSYAGSFRGSPMFWTSVVKLLRSTTASTGDESIEQASAQSLSFHRSYVSPQRVDFGPFQSGFLSLLSGMTSAPAVRPRAGVCLPMGVKIPAQRDLAVPAWSAGQSRRLRAAVDQYGRNWVLISGVLCGYSDFGSGLSRNQVPRSPRDCRDQWQKSSAAHPNESIELVLKEMASDSGVRQEVTAQDSMKLLHLPSALTFLHPSVATESEVSGGVPSVAAAQSVAKEADPPGRFRRIMAAKILRQSVLIAIPGLGSDGSQPQIVASHPSHMQAVQTSAAAAWSSGRTEMWPLQLLDSAERYKNSLAAAGAPSSSSSAAAAPHQPAASSRSTSASAIPSQPNGGARLAPPTSLPAPAASSPSYARLQPRLPAAGTMPPTAAAPSLAAPPQPHPPAHHGQPRPAMGSAQSSFLPPQQHQLQHHPQVAGAASAAPQPTAGASHAAALPPPPAGPQMMRPDDRGRSESDPRSAGAAAQSSPSRGRPQDSSAAP